MLLAVLLAFVTRTGAVLAGPAAQGGFCQFTVQGPFNTRRI